MAPPAGAAGAPLARARVGCARGRRPGGTRLRGLAWPVVRTLYAGPMLTLGLILIVAGALVLALGRFPDARVVGLVVVCLGALLAALDAAGLGG